MKMNWNTVIGQLSERVAAAIGVIRRHPVVVAAAAGGLALLMLALSLLDLSPALTSEQERQVRDFVVRTNSPAVAQEYDQARQDGLTANEVQRIIEVAKRQDPGYGLISDEHPPAGVNP